MDITTSISMCLTMVLSFLFFALLFEIRGEKGAMLVTGFNTLPAKERQEYDQLAISIGMRNNLLKWAALFTITGFLCYFVLPHFVYIGYFIWILLFSKEVKLDAKKAFEKYKY